MGRTARRRPAPYLFAIGVDDAARNSTLTFREQGGRVARAGFGHGSTGAPTAGGRVVELGGGQREAEQTAAAAHDKDLAIRQQRRRMPVPAFVHARQWPSTLRRTGSYTSAVGAPPLSTTSTVPSGSRVAELR